MKHEIYMCEDCMECRDPDIYCKFRSSCPIHFITKRKGNLDVHPAEKIGWIEDKTGKIKEAVDDGRFLRER